MTELRRLAQALLEHPPLERIPLPELGRRVRRRRLAMGSGVMALVVAAMVAIGASIAIISSDEQPREIEARPAPSNGPATSIPLPPGVTANAGALEGQRPVAFATKQAVVVISDGRAVALPKSSGACCIQFGRRNRLAYLRGDDLWVSEPDGDQRVRLARHVDDFTWSSGGDFVIALSLSKRGNELHAFLPHRDAPNGRFYVTRIAPHREVEYISAGMPGAGEGFSFVARSPHRGDPPELFTVDLRDLSRPLVNQIEYTLPNLQAPYCMFLAEPSGHGGPLVWPDEQCSGSIAMDGLRLTYVAKSGATHELGVTLLKDSWIAWAPDGTHLLAVTGGGRDQYRLGRTLTLCEPVARTCAPLNGGDVALVDPAWSPDGSRIAYVSTDATEGLGPVAEREALYDRRTLRVADADGAAAFWANGAGSGVAEPHWTDPSHLLYVRNGSLYLIDVRGGEGVLVAGPLPVDPTEIASAAYEPTSGSWSDFFAVGG